MTVLLIYMPYGVDRPSLEIGNETHCTMSYAVSLLPQFRKRTQGSSGQLLGGS
jgi:hypothetical protein